MWILIIYVLIGVPVSGQKYAELIEKSYPTLEECNKRGTELMVVFDRPSVYTFTFSCTEGK